MTETRRRTSSSWLPLRASLVVAAAFVLGRTVFRVVFGGAANGSIQLPSLPRVDLPAPFSSVSLFGPVTVEGLLSSVWTALPIVCLILASGVLFSLIDLRRLLFRTRRWGAGTATLGAVIVALATIPEIRRTTTRLRAATRLLARRVSATRFTGAVLGASIERATALAASLEARGYLGRSLPAQPDCDAPVELDNATLTLPDGRILFSDVTLALPAGSLTLLTGDTGSGKTCFLRAVTGLFDTYDHGRIAGSIRVGGIDRVGIPARNTAGFVAYVPQDVRQGFVAVTVAEEVGAGLLLAGEPHGTRDVRVLETAREVGIEHLLDRDLSTLSAGEATLVAVAAALVTRPSVLLLDEPLADLDDRAVDRVLALIGRLIRETGITVVVAEHGTREIGALAHQHIMIREGRLDESPAQTPGVARQTAAVEQAVAIERPVATTSPVDMLATSDIIAVVGPNGSGKTTLLWQLALPEGKPLPGRRLVPDQPLDLLTHLSVREECRSAHAEGLFHHLGGASVAGTSEAHPRDLSTGQQRLLAMAVQWAADPEVLLIDEPTRGLDRASRRQLTSALQAIHDRGVRVILATHDSDFVAELGSRVIAVEDARVDPDLMGLLAREEVPA